MCGDTIYCCVTSEKERPISAKNRIKKRMVYSINRPAAPRMLRPARGENDTNGLENDENVEQERAVLEVIKIVGKFFFGLDDIGAVMRVVIMPHLCPSREAGSDEVSRVVVRDTRIVLIGKRG